MAKDRPRVYVESQPIIDLVKVAVGTKVLPDREDDAWHLQRMLDAARDGKVQVFTSALSIAECTHVEDQKMLDQAKPFFMGLLASGRGGFTLIQPTLNLMERARDLRWLHGINLRGADAIHAASALHFGCSELWTRDGKLAKAASAFARMQLSVCTPRQTRALPVEYRQGALGM